MAISNKFGWLVLTTGNKSEVAVGYATLYGDMAGGFASSGTSRRRSSTSSARCAERSLAGHDLIPQAVLDKPPSAELRPDQRDDESLPPYAVLDPILEGYVEQDMSVRIWSRRASKPPRCAEDHRLVDRAEYKRRQAPPGPRVTSRGFGKDRRMPITNGSPGV